MNIKFKTIENIIFIFIIIFIIILCLFVINKINIDTFTEPTRAARLFKAPFPYGIKGPNVNTNPKSTMQLFNTNGTLSWNQSRTAAKLLGGDLPSLSELQNQLNLDRNANTIDNNKYNFGESWYPYVELPDYGWACFKYSGKNDGTPHVPTFGNPLWGTTSNYYKYRTHLYVQFANPIHTPIATQPIFIDGKKTFNYLTIPTYSNTVLNRYYLNDDTILNGTRAVNHPYQSKDGNYYGVLGKELISYDNANKIISEGRSKLGGYNRFWSFYINDNNNEYDKIKIAAKDYSSNRYRNFGIRF